jgi:hypothetical protein
MTDKTLSPSIQHIVSGLTPYVSNSDSLGRVSADLRDLVDASRWLLEALSDAESKVTSADELESFLIDLEVTYLDHVAFHIRSLKDEIGSALANFPVEED